MDTIALMSVLPFITACLIIEATPGLNMAYLAIVSISDGRKAGFAVTTGVALGLFVIGVVAALGVGSLVSSSEIAYQTLRIAGVCYLLAGLG